MTRAVLLAAALLLLAPAGALAGEGHGGGKEGGEKIDIHYFDLATVALPIVWQGRVINYVFTDVRVNLSLKADVNKAREKEPFVRDALVRMGSATPFVKPWDFVHVNQPALFAALKPAADRIVGPGQVTGFAVLKETPRHRSNLPRPPGPPPPGPALDARG